jgi:trk system potassium uptake protein TrkH
MIPFKFFRNPDQPLHLTKRLIATNDQIIQILSFLAIALLIYDIGFVGAALADDLLNLYSALLFFLGLGYSLRIYSELSRPRTPHVIIEFIIAVFLVLAAVASFGSALLDEKPASIIPEASRLLLLVVFVIKLSQLSLGVTQWKAHPAMVFILSFLLLILMGTGLLSLPNATNHGISFFTRYLLPLLQSV